MASATTNPKETRERILDAAESLFSDHGFRDVSLRQITSEAAVNIAAVNYHFGSKDALIAEVLSRVVSPINRKRLQLLDEAEARHGDAPVPVEKILESLHRPVVDQLHESEHQESVYLKLAGRCLSEPAENFSSALVEIFQEMIDRYLAAVRKTLPDIDEKDLFWRMHLSFGTMVYALTHGDRVALFSKGRIETPEPEEILDRLIQFTAAGLRSESTRRPARREGTPSKGKATTLASAAACLVLLSSCKSLSPEDSRHHASVKAPAHWIAGPTYRPSHYPDADWVDTFRDKNLSAFVDSVRANNKDLKAAQSRIQIAAANARIAGADLYPQISGNFGGQRNLQNFVGFPIPGAAPGGVLSTRSNQFGLSLNITWEIDLWGRIKAAKKASVADFEASEFDRATAELSLSGQAAKSWFALAEARDQVALSRQAISVFSSTETAIRDRFETGVDQNGRSYASELLLAKSDVETARNNLATQQELVGRASRQLEVLAGDYPAGRAGNSARLPGFPGKVPTGLPATLLDRRPDLAAAERRIAAADQRLLEAKRSLLPAISLTNSFGSSSSDISDLLDGSFSVWSIAGNLAQPILQGGRLRANVSRNESELQLAATEFENAALTAFSEVENALAAEQFLTQRVTALLRSVSLTQDAYNRSRDEFEAGTGDILTVLSAQQRLFTAKSQLLSVRRLRLDNRIDLYLALGGSFQPSEIPADKSTDS